MAKQQEKQWKRSEGVPQETFYFDGNCLINKEVMKTVPFGELVDILADLKARVEQEGGLKEAEKHYDDGQTRVVVTDKISRERLLDESIPKVNRTRLHHFTVKLA